MQGIYLVISTLPIPVFSKINNISQWSLLKIDKTISSFGIFAALKSLMQWQIVQERKTLFTSRYSTQVYQRVHRVLGLISDHQVYTEPKMKQKTSQSTRTHKSFINLLEPSLAQQGQILQQ